MGLEYILRRFLQKTGLDASSEENRILCLDYINEACSELYTAKDLPGCLDEVTLVVQHGFIVALPPQIGIVRAMREAQTMQPWKLSTIRPRYHNDAWPNDSWRNWREKYISPIAVTLGNVAPPTVVVPFVESTPIEVTIVGETYNSQLITETKVIDSLRVTFDNAFISYEVIKKNRICSYNISVEDADGVEISVLYNNFLSAEFRLIDVQTYPFTNSSNSDGMFMEVLYKKALYPLSDDNDEFPVKNYDVVIINKSVQLWAEDKGNVEKAALNDAKANRTANNLAKDQNKGHDIRIETHPTGMDSAFEGLRYRRRYNR